jgi:dienelactone hydrolase
VGKLEWVGDATTSKEVTERRFDVHRDGRVVPGLLWTPAEAEGPRPLVLLGHGAGHDKRGPHIVALARRLVRHHSFAAAAIDGPTHGDRRAEGTGNGALMFVEFARTWAEDANMADDMVADWRETLDELQELDEVGRGPVGWWGLSMGTILGIPFVASEGRVVAAVLGLMGTKAPNRTFQKRFLADARALSCSVLFLLQWEDELMRRDDVLALYAEIGSADKRLHANPGAHAAVPADEFTDTERFLAERLAP